LTQISGFPEVNRAPIVRTGDRDPINFLTRQLVYRRDHWACQSCGAMPYAPLDSRRSGPLHLDHIIPWSAGGSDRSDNLRTLCGPCNRERSNFVTGNELPAMPIVRLCAPCASPLVRDPLTTRPDDALEVYCGSRSHVSWTIKGAQIL
jgi:hypothetical protein